MSERAAEGRILLEPGTLWASVRGRRERALVMGVLQPIATRSEVVEEKGIAFVVHILIRLERKLEAGRRQRLSGTNPFLPYQEDLFVADVSDTHLCLLNRFNVLDHHLLIVTRAFEEQESLLGLRDFEAMWACMAEFEGLAFYNAGAAAGASQRHKHLQMVPLPLGAGPARTPMDAFLGSASFDEPVAAAPGLPFVHALARPDQRLLREPAAAARASLATYLEMLRAVGREKEPGAYNLLATRRWMLLVPRVREAFRGIPVNALGFAGSLLVLDDEQLALLRRLGPMEILRSVSVARG